MTEKRTFPVLWTLLTAVLLSALLFVAVAQDSGGAARGPGSDAVVLRLGDETITQDEFERRFEVALRNLAAQQGVPLNEESLAQLGNLRPAFLEQLATERVLLQEAQRRNLVASEQEVEAQIAQIRENAGEGTDLSTLLEQAGFEDEAALRQVIRESLTLQRVVGALQEEVQVGDQAVRNFYNANKTQFERPEEVCARHILVETEEEANRLSQRLQEGANFAQLARNNSTDTGSAQNGGDLGCQARGVYVQPFEQAAFAAEVGETTEPVQTQFGYHIIRVYDKNPAGTRPLAEVRGEIRQQLAGQRLSEEIAALREASNLEVFPENLPAPEPTVAPTPTPNQPGQPGQGESEQPAPTEPQGGGEGQ